MKKKENSTNKKAENEQGYLKITYNNFWRWLKKLKEYKADYEKQKAGILDEKTIKTKWKFYPLPDPSYDDSLKKTKTTPEDESFDGASLSLYAHMHNICMDESKFTKSSHKLPENIKLVKPHKSLLHFSRTKKGLHDPNNNKIDNPRKPKKIVFEVCNFKEPDILGEEFKKIIKIIYKLLDIKPKRPNIDKIIRQKKINILHKLGYKKSKIIKELTSQANPKEDPNCNTKISYERLLKKDFKELGI